MWRRVRTFLRNAIISSLPKDKLPPHIVPPQQSSKLEAQLEFRNVLRELGADAVIRQDLKSQSILSSIQGKEISSLSGEQLEELARAHFHGSDGYAQDLNKAYELWSLGAEKGSEGAAYSQAVCLREGKGVVKDPERAFALLKDLAERRDYMLAHFAIGVMYSAGEGTSANDELAFQHFLQAAKLGVVPACYYVANCYASGKGVPQSDANALRFYEAGALVGDPASKCSYFILPTLGRYLLHFILLVTLAVWLNTGRGGKADKERAFRLCREAAEAGHIGAVFNLGVYYMSGQGVATDFHLAAEWFEKAAGRGVVHAAVNASKMHWEGVGVPRDLRRAESILRAFVDKSEECREMHAAIVREIEQSNKS